MAEHIKQVERTTSGDGNIVETTHETTTPTAAPAKTQNVVTNLIWFVAGVLVVLLGFRFVLALLDANPANGFANFIYSASHPFVAPFFSLFSYTYHYGVSRFETYTLVAMLVYIVVAWGLVALANINRPRA